MSSVWFSHYVICVFCLFILLANVWQFVENSHMFHIKTYVKTTFIAALHHVCYFIVDKNVIKVLVLFFFMFLPPSLPHLHSQAATQCSCLRNTALVIMGGVRYMPPAIWLSSSHLWFMVQGVYCFSHVRSAHAQTVHIPALSPLTPEQDHLYRKGMVYKNMTSYPEQPIRIFAWLMAIGNCSKFSPVLSFFIYLFIFLSVNFVNSVFAFFLLWCTVLKKS